MKVGTCTNRPSACWKAATGELLPMPSPNARCLSCGAQLKAQGWMSRVYAVAQDRIKDALEFTRLQGQIVLAFGGVLIFLLLLAAVALSGLLSPSHGRLGAQAAASGGYLLRLSGSNTIGSELGPRMVEAWLGAAGATDIRDVERHGSGGVSLDERLITAVLDGRPVRVEVKAHGSATAFTDLAQGKADIGMASRAIKDEEVATLATLGDMRSPASEHVLALDGIAVIVPQTNFVSRLTLAELKGLFTGSIRDWSKVGVEGLGEVHLYARDDKSGTYDAFKSMVLAGAPLGAAKRYEDSATLEATVAGDPAAIGFIGMPYVKTTRAVPLSDGDAPPLLPTVLTVKTEAYALSRRLYLYTGAKNAKPIVNDFIAFAISGAGQRAVRQAQFVDLDLTTPLAEAGSGGAACRLSSRWSGDPDDYCKLRAEAQQLGTSFHFRPGSTQLDNRALSDLPRVLAAVANRPGHSLTLAGFSDTADTRARSCELSVAQARKMADALATLGLPIKSVRGYCDEQQVRDSSTTTGREFNRRVEIYLN